jgi:hypothetical protein
MMPDEVVEEASRIVGFPVSRRTLLRYEHLELIPAPVRGSEGRGIGRFTDYPSDTPFEFYAAWYLKKRHRLSLEQISKIRLDALRLRTQSNGGNLSEEASHLVGVWEQIVLVGKQKAKLEKLTQLSDEHNSLTQKIAMLEAENVQLNSELERLKAEIVRLEGIKNNNSRV